jgi:superfamily II DNA or RNA helicase
MAKFSKNDWIRNVDLVLMDECHGGKSDNKITKILSKISTRHKFGFTGTLPKDKIDYWKIIGMFGPVVYEKKSKELRDEKYLSNVEVKMICLTGHPFMKISYNAEREYLQSHGGRNNIIAKICDKLKKNVLVLVDRIEYGELLHQMINNGAKDRMVYFVHGEMPVEERREIIAQMEERNDVICVAMSSIFSTGINIKNLHYIVFTFAGKSFIRTIQSIGRGLRLHGDKRKLVLFDIFDNTKFSNLHSKKRKEFYDEEEIPWKETRVGI